MRSGVQLLHLSVIHQTGAIHAEVGTLCSNHHNISSIHYTYQASCSAALNLEKVQLCLPQ